MTTHLKSTVADSWGLASDRMFYKLVQERKATFSTPRYAEVNGLRRTVIDITFVDEADATLFLLKYNTVNEDEKET